jgi:hypothetical protein
VSVRVGLIASLALIRHAATCRRSERRPGPAILQTLRARSG